MEQSNDSPNELTFIAIFKLRDKIAITSQNNSEIVKLLLEQKGEDSYLLGFEVYVNAQSFIEGTVTATELANRWVNILTFLKGFEVSFYLDRIYEKGKPFGGGSKSFTIGAVLERSVNIDLTNENLIKIMKGTNQKLNKQLSCYTRAIISNDPITRIREFYLIIDAECAQMGDIQKDYGWVRNIVSHNELTLASQQKKAVNEFGKISIDPSCPKDIDKLWKKANELQGIAYKIVFSQLENNFGR